MSKRKAKCSSNTKKKYFYVYYSYECWGRGYIGKRECWCLPEEDIKYFGSYKDKTFKPTEKIILQTFNSQSEAYNAEIELHEFFQVDINPHFANKAKQKRSIKEFYNEYRASLKIENEIFKNKFIEIVKKSISLKEVKTELGFSSSGSYKTITSWIQILNLDISHFKYNRNHHNNSILKNKESQKQFIKIVKESTSIRQVILKLNLKENGGNYSSIKSWIKLLDLDTSHFTGKVWNKGKKLGDRLSEEQKEKSHYKYIYTITTPDGKIITTKNLKKYCRDNGLNERNMWLVATGKSKTCKGYKVKRIDIK
jgi:hypothetical protein